MKYFTFIVVAILFGAAGWLLRSEFQEPGREDVLLLDQKPEPTMRQQLADYSEGVWEYENSSTVMKLIDGKFTLITEENDYDITGEYELYGLEVTDEYLIFKIKVYDLVFPEAELERMKKEFVVGDPFGGEEFDEHYFKESQLTGYFVIKVNNKEEHILRHTFEGGTGIKGMPNVKIKRQ